MRRHTFFAHFSKPPDSGTSYFSSVDKSFIRKPVEVFFSPLVRHVKVVCDITSPDSWPIFLRDVLKLLDDTRRIRDLAAEYEYDELERDSE